METRGFKVIGDYYDEPDKEGLVDIEQEVEENPCLQIQTLFEYPKSWKNKESMTIEDIMRAQALSFLPAKSLCRFKTVCKDWHRWISNPLLAHLQSQHFRQVSGLFCQSPGTKPCFVSLDRRAYGIPNQDLGFIPTPVIVRAVSNGLLCCSNRFSYGSMGPNDYYVCNPVSKKWRRLPRPTYYHGEGSGVALAYEPSPLDFAARFDVVCAFPLEESPVILFDVYSSESRAWRVSQSICCDLDGANLRGDGVFFNGVAFWETEGNSVLAYNLKNDEHGMVPLPPSNGFQGALAMVRGELCYIRPSEEEGGDGDGFAIEVYGDWNMSLKSKIPIDFGEFYFNGDDQELRVLGCVNEDVLMLLVGVKVCAYDVKEGKLKAIGNFVSSDVRGMKFLPYVNSLISLD